MRRRNSFVTAAFAAVFWLTAGGCANRSPSPMFRQDLRSWGFATGTKGVARNFTDVNFLTDDLLLLNTATEGGLAPVEPLDEEISSKLLLFDVSTGNLKKSAEYPVEKWSPQPVRATQGGRFVVLNVSGVHVCSVDLTCSAPFSTRGPLMVSPGGERLLVGGNGQSERKVLDSKTLKEIDRFPHNSEQVQIGDALLLIDGDRVADKANDKPRQSFFSTDTDAQFLSGNTLAGFSSRINQPDKVVVRRLDGTVMYEIPLQAKWYETHLTTSASGQRFSVDELGYDRWSLPHLLGYGDVPYHFERISVFETATGIRVFTLKWDPRPYAGQLVRPALSPDGHRIALVRSGFLEVFKVP